MPAIPVTLPDLAQNQSGALGILRRLENGAQLTGRVQRPTVTGQTPIQVGQATLPLVLPEPLAPGTLVTLRSQGGRIILDTQPAQQPQGGAPTPPLPTGGGPSVLLDSAPALIKALQANQLPAQAETLQAIQTVLGQVAPEQIPVLALLLARNVPITAETLAAVRERLRARGDLGEILGKLATGIEQLLASDDGLPEELRELLSQLKGNLFWNPRGSLEERIQSLREFLLGFESKVLQGQGLDSDLKSMLMKLLNLFDQSGVSPDHPLRDTVRQALNLMEGAQLASLPTASQSTGQDWIFSRIPFPGDPNPTMVEMAVKGDRDPDNPNQLDLENMEVLLQLNLGALGPLRVRVISSQSNLTLRFSVHEREKRPLILKDLPDLVTTLQTSGFKSVSTDVRVEAVSEVSLIDELGPLREIERKLKGAGQTPRLDIKL
ncbi:MAG: flagellar hook-length control protein FliK [Candidatus Omnitrophica bacterium]|nr:flagellar hook-length control protein FliK [Candidatus Omnitrophota bacterium]